MTCVPHSALSWVMTSWTQLRAHESFGAFLELFALCIVASGGADHVAHVGRFDVAVNGTRYEAVAFAQSAADRARCVE